MVWFGSSRQNGKKPEWLQRAKKGLVILWIAAIAVGMAACSAANSDPPDSTTQGTEYNQAGIQDSAAPTAAPTPIPTPTPTPEPTAEPYDYSKNVSESEPVDDTYFADAVFIGDSRTQGFMMYSGVTDAQYVACVGLNVGSFFSDANVSINGQLMTGENALQSMTFTKVYIMLGLNELGWQSGDIFKEYYEQIIDTAREVNPDAIVYVQSVLPVSRAKSDGSDIYNMDNVNRFNGYIREVAVDKEAYYVDVAEALSDGDGFLPSDASSDGVHLMPSYCEMWLQYLENHTISGTDTAINQTETNAEG